MRREAEKSKSKIAQRDSSPLMPHASLVVKHLGCVDYLATWRAMRDFTLHRTADTRDEMWIVQHPAVYTLGVATRSEHLPRIDNGIPVVKTDRGEYVLDNQETKIMPWQATGYRYVKRQSQASQNLWVSLGDTQTTSVVAAGAQ